MSFLRRIWNRDAGGVPAACTALDIGTEFAKALVFEIDDSGHGIVRGVGRQRQGLAHMAHAENEYVHRIRRLSPLPAGLWVFACNDIKL